MKIIFHKLSGSARLQIKCNKGFTLLELIIVLAVVAILSAILVPNFISITERAKLKSDIQSARVVQNAFDLYIADKPEDEALKDTAKEMVEELEAQNYLTSDDIIQTDGANWIYNNDKTKIKLDLSNCNENIKKLGTNSSTREKEYLYGADN